jgi:hypothetical protein
VELVKVLLLLMLERLVSSVSFLELGWWRLLLLPELYLELELEWRRLEKILCVLELRRQVQELLLLELSRLMKSLLMLDMGWLINRRLLLEMEKMIKDLMLLEELGGLLLGELGLLLDRAWAALLLDRSLGDLIPHAPWHALRPTGSVSDVRIGDAGSKHRRDALLLVWAERCASGHACWEMGVSIPRCRCV